MDPTGRAFGIAPEASPSVSGKKHASCKAPLSEGGLRCKLLLAVEPAPVRAQSQTKLAKGKSILATGDRGGLFDWCTSCSNTIASRATAPKVRRRTRPARGQGFVFKVICVQARGLLRAGGVTPHSVHRAVKSIASFDIKGPA